MNAGAMSRKIWGVLVGLVLCFSCNGYDPAEHRSEIEDIIRFKKAMVSLCESYSFDSDLLGNLILRVEQQTQYATYWKKMEYVRLFCMEEYFPKRNVGTYEFLLDALMDRYRDAEVILGPIERNYTKGTSTYYMVEDQVSGMKYYIEYRWSPWKWGGELYIVSKKEKIDAVISR